MNANEPGQDRPAGSLAGGYGRANIGPSVAAQHEGLGKVAAVFLLVLPVGIMEFMLCFFGRPTAPMTMPAGSRKKVLPPRGVPPDHPRVSGLLDADASNKPAYKFVLT